MFRLNGKNCLDPGFLRKTLEEAGVSCSWWAGKANSFRHVCGVDPSEGHLLLAASDVPTGTLTFPLVIGGVSINVVVGRAVEVEATSSTSTPTAPMLVEVKDFRHLLQKTLVNKDYNVVQSFNSVGTPTFYESTQDVTIPESPAPWSWQTMLTDIWSNVLSFSSLSHADASYPTQVPNDYRLKGWSHRDSLARILHDIGHTLVPKTDGTFSVQPVSADSSYTSYVNGLNIAQRLIDANHYKEGAGVRIPAQLYFYFRYMPDSAGYAENQTHRYIHEVTPQHSYQTELGNSHVTIQAPIIAAYDPANKFTPLNVAQLVAYANNVGPKLIKLLYTNNGQDRTYSGVLDVFPSAAVGRVTWRDTGSNIDGFGSGPTTRLEHFSPVAVPPPQKIITPTTSTTVYEFINCNNLDRRLFLDNPEIAAHVPGASDEENKVAAIEIDDVIECWRILGVADFCKTGTCAKIVSWGPSCEHCSGCFLLNPCDAENYEIIVRGSDWLRYIGKTVLIYVEGVGEICFTVGHSDECDDVNEDVSVDDIKSSYSNCLKCKGCYQLTPCQDSGDAEVRYINNDLALQTGVEDGTDCIGQVWSLEGVCYTVTAYQSPCVSQSETVPYYNLGFFVQPGGLNQEEDCNNCCYVLTPCEGQVGAPDPFEVIPDSHGPDLWDFVEHEQSGSEFFLHYASNGKVLMLSDYFCYTVTKPVSPLCIDPQIGLGTVLETFESCEECGVTCWKECGTNNHIRTHSDLFKYKDSRFSVKRAEDGKCYTYQVSSGTCGTPPIVEFTVEKWYEHPTDACVICLEPKYKLAPACGGSCKCDGDSTGGASGTTYVIAESDAPQIVIDSVGKYLKLEGVCYLVSHTAETPTHDELPCLYGPYEDCKTCQAGTSAVTLVGKQNEEIVGLRMEGPFKVCGTVEVTDECPSSSSSASSEPNSYAFNSLI